jgi:hypothetical protein
MKARIMSTVVAASLATFPAVAQNAKPLKTKKNTSIVLVNLLNANPDCSANAAPISVPVVREKPTNGSIQMTVNVANVAASGNCRERKVPVITLIYMPKTDFVGNDAVTIDFENGNRATSLSYIISVQTPGETL